MNLKAKVVNRFEVSNTHEISVDCNGFNYLIIYGQHVNGGFFAIINHGVSGDLSSLDDVFYNSETIGIAVNNFDTGKVLAKVIAIQEAQ